MDMKNLKQLLEEIVRQDGNNDLWQETTLAAKLLLEGGYSGHDEDIENLEDRTIETGYEFENIVSQGSWYFQETDTWKSQK
jgi:hypothetical protein